MAASVVSGVPVIAPVAVLNVIPPGRSPPESAKAYGIVPPLAVTGVNDAMAVLTVPAVVATAWVVESATLTVSVNVFDEVALAASVTVTVNVVAASVAVGVPLTCPLPVLKLMPAGSVPPVSANAYGVVPPLAVTGVNAGIGVPTVPALLATACAVVSAPFTLSENVFDDVTAAASVTVTVNVVAASVVDGVPPTVPVAVLKVMPVGNAPPLSANA